MAKKLKNIFISLFGCIAMLFAGFFFIGCDVDYSKIKLVAEQTSVNLEVGESVDVKFTIEGFQSGFSNKIKTNASSEGGFSIFETSQPYYLNDSQFIVTITATAGGTGKLSLKTLEGNKECEVQVNIKQYSNTLTVNEKLMYVSNKTNFVPNLNMFTFDANTTEKELSYFHLASRTPINYATHKLTSLDEETNIAVFSDGMETVEATVQKFDGVKLVENNKLILINEGAETEIENVSDSFEMLSVYTPSILNENYSNILSCVSDVFVLPDLSVEVLGGYLLPNNEITHFDENNVLQAGFGKAENIKIVPNNTNLVQYVLRIEMLDVPNTADIVIEPKVSEENVELNFFEYETTENDGKNYKYIKISQKSLRQATTALSLDIYYKLAEDIDDESVKVSKTFDVETEIAPTAITVNGKINADDLTLYRYRVSPLYGWEDLNLDIISNFETSPNFDYFYFTFDPNFIDMMHNNITVASGKSNLFTAKDLDKVFKVRAQEHGQLGQASIKIHLVSDILSENCEQYENGELVSEIDCTILEGASWLKLNELSGTLFFDLEDENVDFSKAIYAGFEFKSATVKFISGQNVVNFAVNENSPFVFENEKYFLNVSASAKNVGIGKYEFMLDNGTSIDVTVSVIKSLKEQSTLLRMASQQESSNIYSSFDRTEGSLFDNVLNIEIQNDSSKGNITFGKTASFEILSNATSIDQPQLDNTSVATIMQNENNFKIKTLSNGDVQISIVLRGFIVENFVTVEKTLNVIVNVSSYSVVDEFYLKNGDNYALSNTIYYGNTNGLTESSSLVLTAHANSEKSNNFFQYNLTEKSLKTIYDNEEDGIFSVTKENFDEIISKNLIYEQYDKKFVYFYALDEYGRTLDRSETNVIITKNGQRKTVAVQIYDGLMFFSDANLVYYEKSAYGDILATYTISFSNVFSIRGYGEFDMNTFSFHYTLERDDEIVLSARIEQRRAPKKYDAHIFPVKYIPVENISLLSSMANVDFSNKKLTATISVNLYPVTATNKDIRLEFVTTNGNPYSEMMSYEVDSSKKEQGVYVIKLSCEKFYNDPSLRGGKDIVDIEEYLTGTLYIYPREWGTTHASLSNLPIKLNIQYRNGSKANPYTLETVEDVLAINANETTLKSHYELGSVVDMSSATNATPIGILNDKVVGFSGSITGTSSQACITNVSVSQNNFVKTVFDKTYTGLFAQINDGAWLENFTVSGSISLQTSNTTYASVLTAINAGFLRNVGVKVDGLSQISTDKNGLIFGTVASINYGQIIQDFTKYEGTGYQFKKYSNIQTDSDGRKFAYDSEKLVWVDDEGFAIHENGDRIKFDENGQQLVSSRDFTGQTPRNMVFFEGDASLLINTNQSNVFLGAVVGANNGKIERISASENFKLFGYSGYSAYARIEVEGNATQDNKVYLGGVAGISSYHTNFSLIPQTQYYKNNKLVENKTNVTDVVLRNLLIGGEIDALSISDATDGIGGVAGYVSGKTVLATDGSTTPLLEVSVENNTSRMFLRGKTVGGIVGFDFYSTVEGNISDVAFGNGNKIEAVDDGRSSVMASQIIRIGNLVFPDEIFESDTAQQKEEKERARNLFFAIGNASTTEKIYWDETTKYDFETSSYLIRTSLPISNSVSPDSGATNAYYGDVLLVEVETNGNFIIKDVRKFDHKDVDLQMGESQFAMQTSNGNVDFNVYFMYYFHVSSDVAGNLGSLAQDEISALNHFTPNAGGKQSFYPFTMNSQNVSINASSSNVLSIDTNGNITVNGTGLESITLSSILNVVVSKTIYVYVVNYFDKNVSSSIFYTSPSADGTLIENDNATLTLRGNSYSNVYAVPSYNLSTYKTQDNEEFSISKNGVLTYKNVAYNLSKNRQITVENKSENEGSFSTAQIDKQMIVFHKQAGANPTENDVDAYTLVPVLKVLINGEYYYFRLNESEINLNVKYQETATQINTLKSQHSMKTNEHFDESVAIVSTNPNELLFFTIESRNGNQFVQKRLPKEVKILNGRIVLDNAEKTYSIEEFIEEYLNSCDEKKDLFKLNFNLASSESGTVVYDFSCQINTGSDAFKNRFKDGNNIYGEYVFTFYSSELGSGVRCSFKLQLDEANLSYVSINNFSDINNFTSADEVIVPTEKGLLEIVLDPIDSAFDKFAISNNEINFKEGSGQAQFTLVYEKHSQEKVEFVSVEDFGSYENDAFTFSYNQLQQLYSTLGVTYNGKIYVSYLMQSTNIQDNVDVGFDVLITHGSAGKEKFEKTVLLHTKLGSFARLTFDKKQKMGDYYYLARGLAYDLSLNSYGFNEDQVSFIIEENGENFVSKDGVVSSKYVSINKMNGKFVLQVTRNEIFSNDNVGCKITIKTQAQKVVNNRPVSTEDVLQIYLMNYVLDYQYVEGKNEDIVEGMQNGVISNAIGNPYALRFSIQDFLEYDNTIVDVVRSVDRFMDQMTQNISWKVYENSVETKLEKGKNFKSALGYYQISSFTVTPMKIYSSQSNVYHFSMSGLFNMRKGEYEFTQVQTQETNKIYTEFSFDVHEQSTQDSPIPVESYDDLMNMKDGEWYILLNDITLPNNIQTAKDQFMPITSKIAGLDGNGKKIKFEGTYDFSGLTNVGLFASVSENTVLKNIKIQLADATFKMNVETFNAGLLAGVNEGIVSNCCVETKTQTSTLSVEDSVTANGSYVGALFGENAGYITNSQSNANIITNVNLSGFVGTNSGHIASSFFRGGSLINGTNTTNEFTAGFAVRNSGKIYASYVSGQQEGDENSVYFEGNNDYIQADGDISGFVFENSGKIFDSYSNIRLNGLSGHMVSGFTFENSGRIERCFSTSVLKNNDDSNYGFVYSNDVQNENSVLENGIFDCFYLSESIKDQNNNEIGINVDIGQIIVQNPEATNIKPLNRAQFGEIETHFANFVVEDGRKMNSVWFYNNNPNDTSNFKGQRFNVGRLELVSANIVASSVRRFDRTETVIDPATGASYVKYVYVYDEDAIALGDVFNPILISNASEFERFILQENNSLNYNRANYRLISDIDYTEHMANSQVYETRFVGYLEGNFMTVSGQTLLSNEKMTFAGLFAEIGSSTYSGAVGTVMNFTYAPKTVDFANTSVVGALAGKVDGGKIINVKLEGQGTVVGNNIVGGGIGLTTGNFHIENFNSSYSAKARNQEIAGSNLNTFDSNKTGFDGYSFAGSVVGVASGNGKIENCLTNTVVSAIADKAGLMFGFVDENVEVENVLLQVQSNMQVIGYRYAGFVAGESKGTLKNVVVEGEGNFVNFRQITNVPTSIGGIAGLVSGGTLESITMNQSIVVGSESDSAGVEYLGAVAGVITGMDKISDVVVEDVTLVGYCYVGGVAGSIETKGVTEFENLNVKAVLKALGVGQEFVGIGGLAGFVGQNSAVYVKAQATDIQNEIERLENEIKLNPSDLSLKILLSEKQNELQTAKTNNIDVQVRALVYSYGEGKFVDMNIGAIFGDNNSADGHSIFDTNCSITMTEGGCVLTDLGEGESHATGTISVKASQEGNAQLSDVDRNLFDCRLLDATRTNVYCNITYSVSMNETGNALCKLKVLMYGTVYLPSAS